MQVIVLLGPPGAGKDTQADYLKNAGYTVARASELIDRRIALGDDAGLEMKRIKDSGHLVDPEIVNSLVGLFLIEQQRAGKATVVLNGYPRSLAQAEFLDEFLAGRGARLKVIELRIGDLAADSCPSLNGRRLKRIEKALADGQAPRADDLDEAVFKERLRVYHAETEPLIDFYKARGVHRPVDGLGSPEAVRQAVARILHPPPRPLSPQP